MQRRFPARCHQLAASGETCVVQENGRALARLTPEPLAAAGTGRSCVEDLAEWERTHPDEADHDESFVAAWQRRGVMDARSPCADEQAM